MKRGFDHFGHRFDPTRDDVLYLCVDRWIRLDGARDRLISFDLRTEADIDAAIEALSRQLQAAGRQAKAALGRRAGRRKGKSA